MSLEIHTYPEPASNPGLDVSYWRAYLIQEEPRVVIEIVADNKPDCEAMIKQLTGEKP